MFFSAYLLLQIYYVDYFSGIIKLKKLKKVVGIIENEYFCFCL